MEGASPELHSLNLPRGRRPDTIVGDNKTEQTPKPYALLGRRSRATGCLKLSTNLAFLRAVQRHVVPAGANGLPERVWSSLPVEPSRRLMPLSKPSTSAPDASALYCCLSLADARGIIRLTYHGEMPI